jgi:hypothetical protein
MRRSEPSGGSSIEQYISHLEDLCGREGRYEPVTEDDERPPLYFLHFADVLRPGSSLSFTYGLSSVAKKEWTGGRPELVLSLDTDDITWGLTLARFALHLRDRCLFSYGDVLDLEEPIVPGTWMSAFLLFIPSILNTEQARIELPDRLIHIVQAYPIFPGERRLIRERGPAEFFFREDVDLMDVHRTPLIAA